MRDTAQNKQTTEVSYLPPAAPPTNHGDTLAAWFAMAGVMIGALIGSVGFVVSATWLIWVGAAVVVLALLAGLVLRNMGYGQKKVTR